MDRISARRYDAQREIMIEIFLPVCIDILLYKTDRINNHFTSRRILRMDIVSLLQYTFGKVVETFSHNWYLLLLSIVISASLKLYVDQDAIARFLRRNTKNSILMSTGVAVATPLCSCGTTAIVLGMMASTVPWAPIVAFLVSSPLTSPQELFYSAGLFGWRFATAFFVASILLGLMGGTVASFAEKRGWLKNQARMVHPKTTSLSLGMMERPSSLSLSKIAQPALELAAEKVQYGYTTNRVDLPVVVQSSAETAKPSITPQLFVQEMWTISKRLFPLFLGFTFVGYILNGLIPATWITGLFGEGHAYSIPLAAILGLPFYINTEASLPLVRAMLESGMSQGAALAFLITGAGTSLGALGGALTIARWRIIAIVIGILCVGSILIGFTYNILLL